MSILARAPRPCAECPWRRDQPPGKSPPERYEALRDTSATRAGGSAPFGTPLFACHMSRDDRACAGWLAVEGAGHVGVRLAVVAGRLDAVALAPGADWPELYCSYDDLAEANGCDR